MHPKLIGIIGAEGVAALHLAGPMDAFLAASLDDGYGGRIACYDVCSIGLVEGPFRTDSGMFFTPEYTLETAPPLDTIVIPGGPVWKKSGTCDNLADWLLRRAGETRRIATTCTGVYALATTGLLDGLEVTVHWRFASDLARRFPALRVNHRKSLIKDGLFYTSAGVTAGLQLALLLIEEDYGPHVARSVGAELTLYEPRENETAIFRSDEPAHRFADLVSWMVKNLEKDLTVETLARRACISQNHFSRAFKSVFGTPPSEFVENLRLNEARRRLLVRARTLESVATAVGFHSTDTFSRAFKRRFGVRPRTCLQLSSGDVRAAA
jgi:transcriptional regulator GlxA family with amidase domain